MKKVVKKMPESAVCLLTDVDESKYYGAIRTGAGERITALGYLGRRDFESQQYVVHAMSSCTHANCWNGDQLRVQPGLTGMIEEAWRLGFEIFEFNTPLELFSWLVEKMRTQSEPRLY